MKSKENDFEKNISRLVKLAGDSDKPSKAFSDSLIDDTLSELRQAKGQGQARVVWFKRPAWIGTAAAVLVVGLLLMISHLGEDEVKKREFAKDLRAPAEKTKLEKQAGIRPAVSEVKGTAEIARVLNGVAGGEIAKRLIRERPPFAPASAIELVTLPRRDKVQLTIYNSADLTLVRERRNLTLKKGWNWLQFMWANTLIDPTSLSLEPLEQADKIDIQQLVFPARLRELGRWLIRSETEGQVSFEVTYFTSGFSWRAFYVGTLTEDEKAMQLQGYVRVANKSGEDYEKAQTRLIVGKVHILDEIAELARRQYPYGRPVAPMVWGRPISQEESLSLSNMIRAGMVVMGSKTEAALAVPKEIKKEGLSEYFLYTIEGTETIPDKWGKRLISFDVNDIEVKSLYKYDEERWGNQTIRFVKFANDDDHKLGETPIPNGTVKIYGQADSEGHLSYVGGTNIKYIPVDEEVELNLGPARLVSVKPTLMDFETDNYLYDRKGNIAGWDEERTWKIEITNTRELPVEIEITRGFDTAYWTLEFDEKAASYEKHDAKHARFKATIGPRSKQTFRYTVTTYHGRREEAMGK